MRALVPIRYMGRRVSIDLDNQEVIAIRSLRSSGNSKVITIPPEVLDVAKLESGDEVVITADMTTGQITIGKSEDTSNTESE